MYRESTGEEPGSPSGADRNGARSATRPARARSRAATTRSPEPNRTLLRRFALEAWQAGRPGVEVDGRTVPTTPEGFGRRHPRRGLTTLAHPLWGPEANQTGA